MIPNSRESLVNTNLFVENKYFNWYYNMIFNRMGNAPEGYSELHHIIPKSLGGTNDSTNLVRLTAREHFIVHMLLTKCMSTKNGYHKMVNAAHRLIYGNDEKYVYNSKLYESVKIQYSKVASERFNSWWDNFTPEQRSEMRSGDKNSRYGKPCPENVKQAISKANKGKQPRLGITHTEETKLKISNNKKGKYIGKKWYHSPELKKSILAYECPDGFKLGRLPGEVKPSYGAKGKKWYHNPITKEISYFKENEQPAGFIEGRSFK